MKIELKKCMNERDRLRALSTVPGPFVTLSRQLGCDANKVTAELIRRINKRQEGLERKREWKYLNKEIIEESAIELKLSPDRLKQRVVEHGMSAVENIFGGMGGQPKLPNERIIKSVKELMLTYAQSGHVILVGRGGAAITQKIPNALHVKLMASHEWRIGEVSRRMNLARPEAIDLIKDIEYKRQLWSEHLSEVPFDDNLYDLILNCQKLNDDELMNILLQVMEDRKMIPPVLVS